MRVDRAWQWLGTFSKVQKMSKRIKNRMTGFLLVLIALCSRAPSSFAEISPAAVDGSWTPIKVSLIPGKWEFPKKQHIKGLRLGIGSTDDWINGIDVGIYAEATQMNGVQLSFVGGAHKLNGLSLGGFTIANQAAGIQANLIGNWALESLRGSQIGAMNIASEIRGAQIGVWNGGDIRSGAQLGVVNINFGDNPGLPLNPSDNQEQQDSERHMLQVGLINYTRSKSKGVQIGVINLAHSLHGLQFGLINYIRVHKTLPFAFSPILNFSF